MSAAYPTSPEQLRPLGVAAAMAALQRGFERLGVDFYIAEAVAHEGFSRVRGDAVCPHYNPGTG